MSEQNYGKYVEKSSNKFYYSPVFFIIIGLTVFIALAFFGDFSSVLSMFASFQWQLIPLLLLLTLLNYALRFVKWQIYLKTTDINIRFTDSLAIFLSGLSMAITPAKIGELFKAYLLKKYHDVDLSRTIPVVFAEKFTDGIGMLLLAAVSFSSMQYGGWALVLLAVLCGLLLITIRWRGFYTKLITWTTRLPFVGKYSDNILTAYESTYNLFQIKISILTIILSVISWGFECLSTYFILAGFGLVKPVAFATFIFSFSSMIGAISMVPGGLGVAEGSITGLLMLNGVDKSLAASATILIRFVTLWFGVLIGYVSLVTLQAGLNKNEA
jgi:uncharacterized protein (TIRG00374 family)